MGDSLPPRANRASTLRDRFESEKRDISYTDIHSEVTKNVDNMKMSSSGLRQKQRVGSKAVDKEEIVKHMSKLPSYLERGENRQDKALNFGVMDWQRLEKWQYNNKLVSSKSNKYSPSSSNSSSYFSTDGSSIHSSRGHSCSPTHQKLHRPTLHSHLNASPNQMFTPCMQSTVGNIGKSEDFKDATENHRSGQTSRPPYQPLHKNQLEIKSEECKRKETYSASYSKTKSSLDLGSCQTTSSSKGKMKIQDNESIKEKFPESCHSTHDQDFPEMHKNVVLLLPRDGPDKSRTNGKSMKANRRSFHEGSSFEEIYHSDPHNNIARSCPLQTEALNGKRSQLRPEVVVEESTLDPSAVASSARMPTSPSGSKKLEVKRSTMSSKFSDLKTGTVPSAASKGGNLSPLGRFTIGMSKIGRSSSSGDSSAVPQLSSKPVTSKSASDRVEASLLSHSSTNDDPNVLSRANSSPSRRAHSSPLRRLLDPLFSSKATNSHQVTEENKKLKMKGKLDLGSCKEINVDDSLRNEKKESAAVQALFQVAVKNGRPLFTFAVENNSDILAATVRRLSAAGKDNDSWIYTFFTIHEVKKKNGSWLNQGSKGKGQGYVPNIAAQMKVSNLQSSNLRRQDCVDQCSTRQFVLFAVDLRQSDDQISDVQPSDELVAIVSKFPMKVIREENDLCVGNEDHFRTSVILPGGDHGLPCKGEPSPLIERWRSGGLCDCGGWDMGCRIKILANQTRSSRRSNSTKIHSSTGIFELFSQGEYLDKRPFFSLSPLKEGIFSVEFNSSISLLQAFAICISVLDSRNTSQHSESSNFLEEKLYEVTAELKTSSMEVPNQMQDEVPLRYASYPPLSPAGRV